MSRDLPEAGLPPTTSIELALAHASKYSLPAARQQDQFLLAAEDKRR